MEINAKISLNNSKSNYDYRSLTRIMVITIIIVSFVPMFPVKTSMKITYVSFIKSMSPARKIYK